MGRLDFIGAMNLPTLRVRAKFTKRCSGCMARLHRFAPKWPSRFRPAGDGQFGPFFLYHSENSALAGQKARARRGFLQIQAGLNYYAVSDDMVPALRYRPLKDAADRFAATAKSAQQDFLLYMEKIEEALRDSL